MAWFSSINGPLGTGTFPGLGRELSPGRHVITVTATDKAGLTARQTLTITLHNITVFVSDLNFGPEEGTATAEARIPDFGPR